MDGRTDVETDGRTDRQIYLLMEMKFHQAKHLVQNWKMYILLEKIEISWELYGKGAKTAERKEDEVSARSMTRSQFQGV